jgi:hypothetical protein
MDQITHSLSNLTLFVDDALQSSDATARLNSLVHTCHLLHHRNEQLCMENERLKKQIECLLESTCMVPQPNVVVPDWIK